MIEGLRPSRDETKTRVAKVRQVQEPESPADGSSDEITSASDRTLGSQDTDEEISDEDVDPHVGYVTEGIFKGFTKALLGYLRATKNGEDPAPFEAVSFITGLSLDRDVSEFGSDRKVQIVGLFQRNFPGGGPSTQVKFGALVWDEQHGCDIAKLASQTIRCVSRPISHA